jgi:16S rRNA (uracil1498-N3)-methyltransferase
VSATVFARGPFQAGGVVILEDEEAHHVRVRRLEDGASLRLVDGRGGVATARLALEGAVTAARVVATTSVAAPPLTELIVGAGDRDRLLNLVEKATELGVTRIVPIVTERSRAVATRFQTAHLEKAQRRCRDAVKQCGAAWLPTIVSPLPLAEAIRTAPRATRLLAEPSGPAAPLLRETDPVVWAVGPEGGFSEAESASLEAAGFAPVSLGRGTLRFDTAAIAALAVVAAMRSAGSR